MMRYARFAVVSLTLAVALATAGCDRVAESSRTAQAVTKHTLDDTKASWRGFFTYHPPLPDPLPQTRYCYQMQSDVVCYDGEQRMLTSKLVGYQDGENISWVQPGGGSLGASGGAPVALRPVQVQTVAPPTRSSATDDLERSVSNFFRSFVDRSVIDVLPKVKKSTTATASNATSRTVDFSKGEIDVNPLPPSAKTRRR